MDRSVAVLFMLFSWIVAIAPVAAQAVSAQVEFERGERALRQNPADVETALEALSAAASLDPENPRILSLFAKTLLIHGRAHEAYQVLEQLRGRNPDAEELLYLRGLARYRVADWEGAREDLSAAIAKQPNNGVLHLLLGRVHHELGDLDAADRELGEALRLDRALSPHVSYRRGLIAVEQRRIEDAMGHFEEVQLRLAGSELSRSAERHLASLHRERMKKWEVWISLGGGYDSNVNLANDDDIFSVSDASDLLGFGSIGASYVPFQSERLHVQVGQEVSSDFHSDETDFNLQVSQTWSQARWLVADRVAADLRYSFEYVWADGDAFRSTHALAQTIDIELTEGLLARASYRYENRSYYAIDLARGFDRDGQVGTAGLDLYWELPQLARDVDGWLRVGYRYREEHTSGDQYDAEGHAPVVTLGLTLPSDLIATVGGRCEWRRYDNPSLLDPTEGRRSDRIARFYLSIRRVFDRHLSVEFLYRRTKRSSNAESFDYRRNEFLGVATYRF